MYDEFLVRRVQKWISGPRAVGVAGPVVVGDDAGGVAPPRKELICAWPSSHVSSFM